MKPFISKGYKKQALLGLLVVFVIALVALLVTYGIKYFYMVGSSETITELDISESQIPQSFNEFEIVVKTDPMEESSSPFTTSQYEIFPNMDFRLDNSFKSELKECFPNFKSCYRILLKPKVDLKELLQTLWTAEKYTMQKEYKRQPAVANFILNLREKFFSICSFKLKNDPNDLFNLFREDLKLLLVFTGLSEPYYTSGNLSTIMGKKGFLASSSCLSRKL
jgi:hypothetical protein